MGITRCNFRKIPMWPQWCNGNRAQTFSKAQGALNTLLVWLLPPWKVGHGPLVLLEFWRLVVKICLLVMHVKMSQGKRFRRSKPDNLGTVLTSLKKSFYLVRADKNHTHLSTPLSRSTENLYCFVYRRTCDFDNSMFVRKGFVENAGVGRKGIHP